MARSRESVEDEFLVAAAKQGDSDALNRLLERWQEPLLRYFFALSRHSDVAWDLLQETCLGVARGIRKLRDPAVFPKWVYTLASRRYADAVRKDVRLREVHRELKDESRSQCQTEGTGFAETWDRVRTALEKLARDDRRLLRLAYLEEIPQRELGALLGIPVGTVKSRLFRAKENLRKKLNLNQEKK